MMSELSPATSIDELFAHSPQPVQTPPRPTPAVTVQGHGYEVSKRLVDIVGATLGVVALLPVFVVVALVVKLTSPGPVIFRQRRLGRGGREFWCFKFRTMVADAEQVLLAREDLRTRFDESYKLKNDPRVTRPGAFLRKTSLDELPQLFNVLNGSMSLIGPRPIVPRERDKYGDFSDKLLSVKPGLGGVWQVYGRSDTTYPERVAMDMAYVDSRSLPLDLKLIALTFLAVWRRRGAY